MSTNLFTTAANSAHIRPIIAVLFTCSVLLLAGCSGDGSKAEDIILPNGSMSAKIDGTSWQAELALFATDSGQFFAVGASGGGKTLGFAALKQEGTQQVSDGAGTNANYSETASPGASWVSTPGTGVGSVTVTSINATGAKGTFSFQVTPLPNTSATGTKSITEGRFDVTFSNVTSNTQ